MRRWLGSNKSLRVDYTHVANADATATATDRNALCEDSNGNWESRLNFNCELWGDLMAHLRAGAFDWLTQVNERHGCSKQFETTHGDFWWADLCARLKRNRTEVTGRSRRWCDRRALSKRGSGSKCASRLRYRMARRAFCSTSARARSEAVFLCWCRRTDAVLQERNSAATFWLPS